MERIHTQTHIHKHLVDGYTAINAATHQGYASSSSTHSPPKVSLLQSTLFPAQLRTLWLFGGSGWISNGSNFFSRPVVILLLISVQLHHFFAPKSWIVEWPKFWEKKLGRGITFWVLRAKIHVRLGLVESFRLCGTITFVGGLTSTRGSLRKFC